MKAYEQLTFRGKLKRLRSLAQKALKQYDLPVSHYKILSYSTNLLYKVYTETGNQYVLRLASPGWRNLVDLQSEAMWLEALAKDTDINAPRIIRASNGKRVLTVKTAGIPREYNATLMSWLPGMLLGKRLTEKNIFKMGELLGKLHIHGKNWRPSEGFTIRRFNKAFSRGEPDVMFAEENLDAYSPEDLKIIRLMREKVDEAYKSLNPDDLRVIHCDLWHDNIKIYKGELYPFDFEDTIWGYRLHDIAMAMLDLVEDVEMERYEQLLKQFKLGYKKHLQWPEGDMTILQIGRMMWRINYIARFERKWLANEVKFCADLFRRYQKQGKLADPLKSG